MTYKLSYPLDREGQQALDWTLNSKRQYLPINCDWCLLLVSPDENNKILFTFTSWHQTREKARQTANKMLGNFFDANADAPNNRYFIILKKEEEVHCDL